MATSTENTIDQLNSFLRGELSAVETYQQAISRLPTSVNRGLLEECRRSHQRRAELLAQEIRRRGGEPAQSSGAWGAFAKLVEGGAQVFGENMAIAALEEGEDHGRDDYQRDLSDLEPAARSFVEQHVLPEQLRTHDAMRVLKKSA
jgi:uncharacterized protein (TIGR02284 family)